MKRRTVRRRLGAGCLIGTAALALVATGGGTTLATVPSPSGGPARAHFDPLGIVALSPTDVRVAGSNDPSSISHVWQYDGTAWTDQGGSLEGRSEFAAIDGSSADDAWAVGYDEGGYSGVIEHWNGTAWTLSTHWGSGDYNFLASVSSPTPRAVWVAGSYGTEAGDYTVVLKLVNGAWKRAEPNPDLDEAYLSGISALSNSDVWAVGGARSQGVIDHWDGAHWSELLTGPPLDAVSAISADDVWAVGGVTAEHWDGTAWNTVPLAGRVSEVTSVSAAATDDVWVVGAKLGGGGTQSLVEHWDGSHWTVVPSPNSKQHANVLRSVSADSADDAWAAGAFGSHLGSAHRPLFLHWNGTSWSRVSGH